MNYRHIYHAGNFADVFKHWILTLILEKMCEKSTPFCVLDTHAGLGIYDLKSTNAQKTLEHEFGVNLILNHQLTNEFQSYVNIVKKYQELHKAYPGSPAIIKEFLRNTDRLLLTELHPEDYAVLHENFKDNKQIYTFQQDAYISIKAHLPPKERRGLILIDPPFEQSNEFEQIVNSVQQGLKRFANGIYAIWYPIKEKTQVAKFYRDLTKLDLPQTIYIELHSHENVTNKLSACGMTIINPPWKIEQILHDNLPRLIDYLDLQHGSYKLEQLVEII